MGRGSTGSFSIRDAAYDPKFAHDSTISSDYDEKLVLVLLEDLQRFWNIG